MVMHKHTHAAAKVAEDRHRSTLKEVLGEMVVDQSDDMQRLVHQVLQHLAANLGPSSSAATATYITPSKEAIVEDTPGLVEDAPPLANEEVVRQAASASVQSSTQHGAQSHASAPRKKTVADLCVDFCCL